VKHESESKRKLLEAAIEMISQSSYGSVSVDDICAKAGVNKGSFYYAFKSKSDLAVAAYERHWEHKREKLDRIFSPQLGPLERLDLWMKITIEDQRKHYEASGKMIGCPFCSIGSELSSQDENIRRKSEEIGVKVVKYIESLVRDLAAEGLIEVRDTHELAEEVGAYVVGVLLQAKIDNSMKQIEKLKHGVVRLLGIKEVERAAA
jgi:TetR/AcrR family transcriptional repressor of nem operon